MAAKSAFLGNAVASKATVAPVPQSKRLVVLGATKKITVSKPATKRSTVSKPATVKSSKPKVKADGELAKWYGPDRKLFLPVGLYDRSEVPAYLAGEVPGDYGFDTFGLSKKPQDFAKYQANELIHGRWAMLGALGFILPEALNKFGAYCGPEAVWWKTGALLLDGNTLYWSGIPIPVNLIAAVVFEAVLVGGAEYYRSKNESPLGTDLDPLYPGGYFDPLGFSKDPEQLAILKVKEIKNGRLAMFSMLGFFFQAYVTGDGPVGNLITHLSDPFGNNLLTVLGNASERAPTL